MTDVLIKNGNLDTDPVRGKQGPADTLISEFSPPDMGENKRLRVKPLSLWRLVMAALGNQCAVFRSFLLFYTFQSVFAKLLAKTQC